jgi:hypothetical protein
MSLAATATNIGSKVLEFLAKMPAEAIPSFGRLLSALLSGDAARAQREARVTAETIAIKQATRASAKAAKKALER